MVSKLVILSGRLIFAVFLVRQVHFSWFTFLWPTGFEL